MKNNTCKCKQCSRSRQIRKITRRRGGSKFSRFATYFPKRLHKMTATQIAAHVLNENAGHYTGKVARPIKNYVLNLLNDKHDIHIPPPIVGTFKPAMRNKMDYYLKPVPKANVPPPPPPPVDLASISGQIGDILYQRGDKNSSHRSRHSSHRSRHSSHRSRHSSHRSPHISHTAIRVP
jgi:hypothetical protein